MLAYLSLCVCAEFVSDHLLKYWYIRNTINNMLTLIVSPVKLNIAVCER